MLTVLVAAKRRSDLTHEEFIRYWIHEHAPLVMSVQGFQQYLRRYVIYPLIDGIADGDFVLGQFPGYDGIGELRFDDTESMKKAFSDPEYLAIIRPDEDKFLDRGACLTFLTREHVQKEISAG